MSYSDFVKSLTDKQLDVAFEALPDMILPGSLEDVIYDEYLSRERSIKLSFYTPHIEDFKRLYAAENEGNPLRLAPVRLFPGWSHELEAAFKTLINELLENLT